MSVRSPNSVDHVVARNIRIARLAKGFSQGALGEALGLTFQQVQKYEKGANRIGCGRLAEIAAILQVPLSSLFEGVEENKAATLPALELPLADRQSFDLLTAFQQIGDRQVRTAVVRLVANIAEDSR